jgi:hypothetical protein
MPDSMDMIEDKMHDAKRDGTTLYSIRPSHLRPSSTLSS